MKLLASDLDGTLINNNIISNEDLFAIQDLQSKKNLFAVSTGRPLNGVEHILNEYQITPDYYILLNGTLILNKEKKTIKQEFIKFNKIKAIIDTIKNYNTNISFETGFTSYNLNNIHENLPYENKIKINNLYNISKQKISLISIFFKDLEIEKLIDLQLNLQKLYGNNCEFFRNLNYIDVSPKKCSKGEGVKLLAQKKDISLHNIFTIGDSFNDVSMFDITPNSFTFYHCEENLKKYTSNLVCSVNDCIKNYILTA
ncbi:MAG: HAD-IIB family hydrolase [Fusobacteriaceae bacterium]